MEQCRVYGETCLGVPKESRGDLNCSNVMTAFSALHLLRYNQLLNHPEVRAPLPLSPHPPCLLTPRELCVPHHYGPPAYLHPDAPAAISAVISLCSQKKRGEKRAIPEEQKDDRYYERRRRNNHAAKKSRDARRLREDQIAMRAMHLEHDNAMLTAQNLTLREEVQTLRQLILKCSKHPQTGCSQLSECTL